MNKEQSTLEIAERIYSDFPIAEARHLMNNDEYIGWFEEAVKAGAEWQAKKEWINCNDELPKEGGRYLCYCYEQNSLGLSRFVWNCSYHEIDKYFSDACIKYYVTHWMPLPPPPNN